MNNEKLVVAMRRTLLNHYKQSKKKYKRFETFLAAQVLPEMFIEIYNLRERLDKLEKQIKKSKR